MAVSVSILAVVTSLHLIAFVFAVGAERRRSNVLFLTSYHFFFFIKKKNFGVFVNFKLLFVFLKAKVVPDQYDERTYCVYGTDASTVYGLAAFGLLLLSQAVLNGVTRCLCFGKGLVSGSSSTACAVVFFVVSW